MIDNNIEVCMDDGEESFSSVTNTDQLMRQSFDRFDDNLVENILSYLTFNEKVLFESVSKRWKKCVYNQQKELQLTRSEGEGNDSLNNILEPIEVVDYVTAIAFAGNTKCINKVWLKSLLKKCKSIDKVYLDCYLDLEDLDIICRNCPKLKSIIFDTSGLSANDLDHIGNRYGHMFQKIYFNNLRFEPKYWNKLLFHCKNLREISAQNFRELLLDDNIQLPKLEAIYSNYYIRLDHSEDENNEEMSKQLQLFCGKFGQTLTDISFSVYGNMRAKQLDWIFNCICNLTKLKVLDFYCYNILEREQGIDKHIRKVSKSCPDIKRIVLYLYSSNCLKINRFFNSFESFSNLVELEVWIRGYNENSSISGSVECLKSLKNLKYLNIGIECIGEEFFKDIDKHLPNLSDLRISSESVFTDKTIIQLSHLKKLKKFNLYKFRKSAKNITDESVCAVIKGCPVLEQLYFGSRPNITNKTIEALICCAKTYPKRRVIFNCGLFHEEDEHEIQSIDMNSFVGKIPENLTIDYSIQ